MFAPHKLALYTLLAALLGAATAHAQVTVQLRSQSSQVRTGEPFVVELRAESNQGAVDNLELSGTEGFQVVGRRQSMATSFSFGFGSQSNSSQTTIQTLTLVANRAGEYTLGPAIATLGTKQFQSSKISVVASGADATPSADPTAPTTAEGNAFLRVNADKSEAYVGEQITIDATLYTRDPLARPLTLSKELQVTGAWTHDLLADPTQTEAKRVSIAGQAYYAYQLKHLAAFALDASPVTIDAMELEGVSGQRFGLRSRLTPILAKSEPITVQIKPIPGTSTPEPAVGRFSLDTKLDRNAIVTGDAVTLVATVSGEGSLSTVKLEPELSDGLRALEPSVDEQVEVVGNILRGTKTFRWIVVAEKPGEHRVDLLLPTFDPSSKSRLPLRASEAFEAAGLATDATTTQNKPQATKQTEGLKLPATRAPTSDARPGDAFWSRPVSWLLLAACVVVFGGVLVARVALGRRKQRPVDPWQQVTHELDQAALFLKDSQVREDNQERQTVATLERALRVAIDARLAAPSASMTTVDLRRALERAQLDASFAQEVCELQRDLESARFSPAGGDTAELMERTRTATRALKKR